MFTGSSVHAAVVAFRLRHVSQLQRRLEHSNVASGSCAANSQPFLVHSELQTIHQPQTLYRSYIASTSQRVTTVFSQFVSIAWYGVVA